MIHKYKLGDYNIVLDVNSGGVHVVGFISSFILRSRMSRPEAYSVALFSTRSFFSRA